MNRKWIEQKIQSAKLTEEERQMQAYLERINEKILEHFKRPSPWQALLKRGAFKP